MLEMVRLLNRLASGTAEQHGGLYQQPLENG